MAIIKCKMCGGDLNIEEGASVAECEYCGSRQTVPTQDSEKKLTLFGRANRLRLACEFDKAAGVYESIVADFPEEAEAYWGLVLCRYGIEYVDDPHTGKKIPTCHRSSFDSVLEDQDFEQACENADAVARKVYREEAKAIEELRRGILEVSGKEAPYDIFICYKETDDKGDRTIDSVIAQDVYDALTEKGYRVFFSRISLEDKLGTEYEPYIFAALNSAKIMLVFGTDYEYFNAVWVKNEWSRFLTLIASGQKKTLIPCYKNIDAYDMPKEFARLQAQDMGKVGAIQDLLRGIEKILPSKKAAPAPTSQPVPAANSGANPTALSLLKRGNIFLADGDWDKANEYFDKTLDIDPENGDAYAGKLCAEMQFHALENMAKKRIYWKIEEKGIKDIPEKVPPKYFPRSNAQLNLNKALRYGSPELKKKLIDFATKAIQATMQEIAETNRKARKAKEKEDYQRTLIEKCSKQKILACGYGYYVGLRSDGTVVATGDNGYGQCNVDNWRDIIAVACGWLHTVGLCANGTVVATGDNRYGQCNVSGWRDIIAIFCGVEHTVGLCANGTVLVTGDNELQNKVSSWKDITSIDICGKHIVGLRADGTVVASEDKGDNGTVAKWHDIVAVQSGNNYAAGLNANGKVVTTGIPSSLQEYQTQRKRQFHYWPGVTALSCTEQYLVGLCSNGTIAGVYPTDTDSLHDIVAVTVGHSRVYCLQANGTVIIIGNLGFYDMQVIDSIVGNDFVAIACYRENRGYSVSYMSGVKSEKVDPYAFGVRADGTVVIIDGNGNVDGWKLFDNVDQLDRDMTERINKGKEERIRVLKTEIATLEEKRAALQEDLSKVKGLFSGRRRWELESQILEVTNQISDLSARAGIDTEDGQP